MAKKPNDEKAPIIIIKKIKKVEGGHHGGAWKVAYADFVTAMMAFFLLLWLLNVTTDEQKMLISSYFAPADPRIATSTSGAGGVMGGTSLSPDGAMTTDKSPLMAMQDDPSMGIGREDGMEANDAERRHAEQRENEEMEKEDNKAFDETGETIKQAIESQPELKEFADNLLVDLTPEGLRIQIIDQDGKPMFEPGSAKPLPPAVRLLEMITKTVISLPNRISLRGHTDSSPLNKPNYSNWELSADRANASRRIMEAAQLDPARIENVQGRASRDPLLANDPASPRNRRISVVILKQKLTPGLKKARKPTMPLPPVHKKEEGVIYFP
jgi:chemotaxis protein MotB